MLAEHPSLFTRAFDTFQPRHAGFVCEFDASLTGICVIMYRVDAQGRKAPVGVGELPVVSMDFAGDSAWQNLSELIDAALSLVMAAAVGATDQTITWAT
jgi:hypothetical protein